MYLDIREIREHIDGHPEIVNQELYDRLHDLLRGLESMKRGISAAEKAGRLKEAVKLVKMPGALDPRIKTSFGNLSRVRDGIGRILQTREKGLAVGMAVTCWDRREKGEIMGITNTHHLKVKIHDGRIFSLSPIAVDRADEK